MDGRNALEAITCQEYGAWTKELSMLSFFYGRNS
jgi:hypothetical protein